MKKILFIITGLILFVLAPPVLVGSYVAYEVFGGNYEHLEKSKIIEILSKETTVYYADGQTQLGSLFGSEHRQYVPLRQMPKSILDSVVAAEDDNFYVHMGIDPVATMRAIFRNVFFRKREGASTITQQTVKNLYGRPVTNLRAKWQEAINAFKIERKYTKKEILEFYLNQFHVTGNGRGVGVAAKYYFDKNVEDLTLTESAFIAGSVKGPERYNPFTKKSLQAQTKARSEAKKRKNYVLRRMLEQKVIAQGEFDKAKDEEVPFQQGRFQFNELFVTELVQRQLNRKEVLLAVGAENIDQIGTMGLRITTTLEQSIQLASQYGVRQNLSRLEMILTGFQKETQANFVNIQRPEKMGFYVGQIKALSKEKATLGVTLSFGVPECQIPAEGIDRVAKITDQAFYRGLDKSREALLAQLNVGDFVLASVKDVVPDGGLVCDLERRPRVQGALIVLDKGKVLAMVGGYSPHEYNRAAFAKRQPGSTFKSLTYYPAMQLGWNPLEPLLNMRNVYTWQSQFYYPRPDHVPESLETTFVGAGSKSENLASVWLMAHLVDRLTLDQFKDLLTELEIYDKSESEQEFLTRVGRMFNVRLLESHLRAGLFDAVRNDMNADVSALRDRNYRAVLKSMNYGNDFDDELARVVAGKGKLPPKEKILRVHVLRNNMLRWKRVSAEARTVLGRLKVVVENGGLLAADDRQAFLRLKVTADGSALAYVSNDTYMPNFTSALLENPTLRTLSPEELVSLADREKNLLGEDALLLDGVLPLLLLKDMETQIDARYQNVANAPVLEKLYWHDDFRYSVGMYYARKMVKEMGVESDVQWVPSYPLGANVVTLAELALAYQTLLEGRTYRYFETPQENQLLLLNRIEDAQGNLLWEAQSQEHQLVDSFFSAPMLSVLRGTVTNGTGNAAHKNVILRSKDPAIDAQLLKAGIRVPIFGKTGTTNDYVNATYVGFLPYPAEKGSQSLSPEHAYTIAAYVGYDTNEPMRKRGFKVAGGTGALPAWIETALSLIKEQDYAGKLDWAALAESKAGEVPFDYGSDLARIAVPLHSSLVTSVESSSAEEGNEKADLNRFIDDYAASKGTPVRVALPGRVSDGVFVPRVRVSFFNARAKSIKVTPPNTTGGSGSLPAGSQPEGAQGGPGGTGGGTGGGGGGQATSSLVKNSEGQVSGGGGSGTSAGTSGENLPTQTLTPGPFVQPRLPEDNFEGGDSEDLKFELPPPPPGLGIEAR